jgi:hypothetical protein
VEKAKKLTELYPPSRGFTLGGPAYPLGQANPWHVWTDEITTLLVFKVSLGCKHSRM